MSRRRTAPQGQQSRKRSIRDAVLVTSAALAPGLLAGAQVAGLLFFLNPQIPFRPEVVARGFVRCGAILGVVSLALHVPWTWARPRRAGRFLPWALSLALGAAALLDGVHASVFAYFLPSGINVRLIKAAFLLGLCALIAFYTALLHTLQGRGYGPRSRAGFLLLAIASLYFTVERREAFKPPVEPSPRPPVIEAASRPELLVVGLDAATFDAILPLAEQGRLPFLAGLLADGAHGRFVSLTPNRRLALWETLATGKYPYKHGILGNEVYAADFLAPGAQLRILPVGIGFRFWGLPHGDRGRPVERSEVLALWQILDRLGAATGVIGWPGSALAPPGTTTQPQRGFVISDRFFRQPAAPGIAYPEREAERARLFHTPAERLDPSLLSPFGSSPPSPVREALAEDVWRESLAGYLLDEERDPAALFVVLPGLAQVSRLYYGGYAAVQFEGIQRQADQTAARLLAAYYAHLDGFLASLWARPEGPKIMAVVSAYGTQEARGIRRFWTELVEGHSTEGFTDGSPDGIVILYGEGIEPGARLSDDRLVDLVPTLLYGLGYPVARDLDGQILTAAFTKPFLASHSLSFVPSYDTLAAPDRIGGSGVSPSPP